MANFNLAFGFDWNSKPRFGPSSFAQLQLCLTEILEPERERIAGLFGEIQERDTLEVSIVDITGDNALVLELITACVVFSGAERSQSKIASPLNERYIAGASPILSEKFGYRDSCAYKVENAPTWLLAQEDVLHSGTFAFSAVILVYEPASGELRNFIVDPEMQVDPFEEKRNRA
ncbi:MAG: hypothetical protein AAF560_34345 [Acidobacteriota bacterium]